MSGSNGQFDKSVPQVPPKAFPKVCDSTNEVPPQALPRTLPRRDLNASKESVSSLPDKVCNGSAESLRSQSDFIPRPLPRKDANMSLENVHSASDAILSRDSDRVCDSVTSTKKKYTPTRSAPPPPVSGSSRSPRGPTPPIPSAKQKSCAKSMLSASTPDLPLPKSASVEDISRQSPRKKSLPGSKPPARPPLPTAKTCTDLSGKVSPYKIRKVPITPPHLIYRRNKNLPTYRNDSVRHPPPKPSRPTFCRPFARALYDNSSDHGDELEFRRGDTLWLCKRIDSNWLECELEGRTGLVPLNYVDIIKDLPHSSTIPPQSNGSSEPLKMSDPEPSRMPDPEPARMPDPEPSRMPDPEPARMPDPEPSRMPDPEPARMPDSEPARMPDPEPSPISEPKMHSDGIGVGSKVKAVFSNTEYLEDGDLRFFSGDIITIVQVVDEDWFRGAIKGREGIFPRNLVQLCEKNDAKESSQEDQEVIYVATGDDMATRDNELRFNEGDEIALLRKVDDNWFFGSLLKDRTRRGLVPFSFAIEHRSQAKPSLEHFSDRTQPIQALPAEDDASHEAGNDGEFVYVIAQYDYSAELGVELSFREGDRIRVVEKLNDDWCKGELRSGVQGIFPTNFTSAIPSDFIASESDLSKIAAPVVDHSCSNLVSKEEVFPKCFESRRKLDLPSDLQQIYRYMDTMPERLDSEVDSICRYVTAKYRNELAMCLAFYRWCAMNISYSWEWFLDRSRAPSDFGEPQCTLRVRSAVCEGYARLFQALCNEGGILCEKISGYGRSDSGFQRHAWNQVMIEDEWYLVDVCWGAGYIDHSLPGGPGFVRRFAPCWFDIDPEVCILSHFPNTPEHSLLAKPPTMETLESLPEIFTDIMLHNQLQSTILTNEIHTSDLIFEAKFLGLAEFRNRGMMFHVNDDNGTRLPDSCFFLEYFGTVEDGEMLKVSFSFPRPGKYCIVALCFDPEKGENSYSYALRFWVTSSCEDSVDFPEQHFPCPIRLRSPIDSLCTGDPIEFFYYGEDVLSMFGISPSGLRFEVDMIKDDSGFDCTVHLPEKVPGEYKLFARRSANSTSGMSILQWTLK